MKFIKGNLYLIDNQPEVDSKSKAEFFKVVSKVIEVTPTLTTLVDIQDLEGAFWENDWDMAPDSVKLYNITPITKESHPEYFL